MADSKESSFEQEFDIEITATDEAALRRELVPYLAQLNSAKYEVVQEAARVLSSSAPVYLESTLLGMLERPETRGFAIKGLEKINTQAAWQALAKLAIEYIEEYSYDREQAMRALSEMGDPAYFPLLKQIADLQRPNQSRDLTIYAATLGGDDAIPWLASKLRDGNPFSTGAVVWALPATGSRRAVPMLIELLDKHEEGLGEAAEIALVQLTHRSNSPETYSSRTPRIAHQAWVKWWSLHPDAPVYGPKLCGEILPLN